MATPLDDLEQLLFLYGSLKARVRISDYMFSSGLDLKGDSLVWGTMDLEGSLVEFRFGNPKETWTPRNKEVYVSVKIYFRQQGLVDETFSDADNKYMGYVQVFHPRGGRLLMNGSYV